MLDFIGGFLGALCQGTNFIGNHRKTAPTFAGPGGLNGGIQGQQIGLFSDRDDHIQNPANRLAVLIKFLHGLAGFLELTRQGKNTVARGGCRTGAVFPGITVSRTETSSLLGILRNFANGSGEFLDGGRHGGEC